MFYMSTYFIDIAKFEWNSIFYAFAYRFVNMPWRVTGYIQYYNVNDDVIRGYNKKMHSWYFSYIFHIHNLTNKLIAPQSSTISTNTHSINICTGNPAYGELLLPGVLKDCQCNVALSHTSAGGYVTNFNKGQMRVFPQSFYHTAS